MFDWEREQRGGYPLSERVIFVAIIIFDNPPEKKRERIPFFT